MSLRACRSRPAPNVARNLEPVERVSKWTLLTRSFQSRPRVVRPRTVALTATRSGYRLARALPVPQPVTEPERLSVEDDAHTLG